jgi:hypothetical protein
VSESVSTSSTTLWATTPAHRRRDYGETALWTAIAMLDAAMLILCSISPKLDPSLTQTAPMVFGP